MFPDAQKKKLMSIAVASQERGVFNVQPYNWGLVQIKADGFLTPVLPC